MNTIEELKNKKNTLEIVRNVARLSSHYEIANTELKKNYTIQEIERINNNTPTNEIAVINL